MVEIFMIVFPVFALIGLGAVAARLQLLSAAVGEGLGRFAYLIALPCLLFRTLLNSQLPATIPWAYWTTYFFAVAVVWFIGQTLARKFFGASEREATIAGLSVVQANTVMIGIPVLLAAYGPAAAVPIALLVGVNLPITMTVATLLFETAGRSGAGTALALVKGLATHPILLAIVAGMLGNLAGFKIPTMIDAPVAMLATTAIPCALVGLGIGLIRYSVAKQWPLVTMVSALKLGLMPALVFAGGTLLRLEPMFLGAAVVFASAPVGINVYIFAMRYQTGVALASGAIALTTLLAVGTTTFWLWMIGLG